MRATRSECERVPGTAVVLATMMTMMLGGCYRGEKLVTVTFTDRGGGSEYWVCPARKAPDAGSCHGAREGEVDPTSYDPNLDVLAPPAECPDGVAKMEIVVRRHEVLRVGYECAMPREPTGLPDAAAAGSGLPPTPPTPGPGASADADGEVTP